MLLDRSLSGSQLRCEPSDRVSSISIAGIDAVVTGVCPAVGHRVFGCFGMAAQCLIHLPFDVDLVRLILSRVIVGLLRLVGGISRVVVAALISRLRFGLLLNCGVALRNGPRGTRPRSGSPTRSPCG